MRRLLPIAIAAALLAGCGEERTRPPDVLHPGPPAAETKRVRLPGAEVSFLAPTNWAELAAAPPLAGGVRLRTATVAVWRYPRNEPLPEGEEELDDARERLLATVAERDPTFEVREDELTEIDGVRGIVLSGAQTIEGTRYDVRSAHLFANGAEIVVDAYALPADFPAVDREVFVPLLDSLRIGTA